MRILVGLATSVLLGLVVPACSSGTEQPGGPDQAESAGEVTQAISNACTLQTIGLPCDPDGPGKPKLECEGICYLGLDGLVACVPVPSNSLDGVICGTTNGVGDAACQR